MRLDKVIFPFLGLLKNNRRNRKKYKMIMRYFRRLNPNWEDTFKIDLATGDASYSFKSPFGVKHLKVSGFILDHKK